MANQKKTSASAKQKQTNGKKKQIKKIVIGSVAAALAVAAVVLFVIQAHRESAGHALRGTQWVSQSAKNASGDEVDIREVYNVKYTQYQGRLTFDDADHFELWLHPGDASDGTHTGTLTSGNGVLAELLMEMGVEVLGETEISRLTDE